ncbi:MAG: hypothetical protein Q9163_005366, partial [Psora crenata]
TPANPTSGKASGPHQDKGKGNVTEEVDDMSDDLEDGLQDGPEIRELGRDESIWHTTLIRVDEIESNGGDNKRPGYDDQNPGKFSAPVYWPEQANWPREGSGHYRHRSPRNLTKSERLNLLVHLLRHGRRFLSYNFDIDALEESTKDIAKKCQDPAIGILEDVYQLRRIEMEYERGKVDVDTMFSMTLPRANAGKTRTESL